MTWSGATAGSAPSMPKSTCLSASHTLHSLRLPRRKQAHDYPWKVCAFTSLAATLKATVSAETGDKKMSAEMEGGGICHLRQLILRKCGDAKCARIISKRGDRDLRIRPVLTKRLKPSDVVSWPFSQVTKSVSFRLED